MSTENLHGLVTEVGEWADATFGPRDPLILCHKLQQEVDELRDSNCEDTGEFADCAMLLFDIARLKGFSPSDIFFAMDKKLLVDRNRRWCYCHHKEDDHSGGHCRKCGCPEFKQNGT